MHSTAAYGWYKWNYKIQQVLLKFPKDLFFLDHQKYLSKIGDLDEYRANMRQHYFSEGPTNRYINPEYDYYGDMDDYNSNHLRDRLREISMDDLYNDLFE